MTIEKLLSELRKIDNKDLLVYYDNIISIREVIGIKKSKGAILLDSRFGAKPITLRYLVAQLLKYPDYYIVKTNIDVIFSYKVTNRLLLRDWW